jgi:hypothetical protein
MRLYLILVDLSVIDILLCARRLDPGSGRILTRDLLNDRQARNATPH